MLTGLPSFIVTLAMFFSLRGINLGVTKALTDTVRVAGMDDVDGFDSAVKVFAITFWDPYDYRIAVVWWIGITIVATTVVLTTHPVRQLDLRRGWRQERGPQHRRPGPTHQDQPVRVHLAGRRAGRHHQPDPAARSMQAGQGIGEEFTFIIAAVVGGCLLTGGYGSAIGASIGASIIGMAFIGIAYAGWNTDWTWLFLGVILFAAVLVNTFISKRAAGAKR